MVKRVFKAAIFLIIFSFVNPRYDFAKAFDVKNKKVLLICLDGATWNLMGPLLEKKQLPNISRLIKNGVSGNLFSNPAFSPPSWTSIATGKISEKHGVHKFLDARKRKAAYLWDILSNSNMKVGIINWLMNLPEKINGFIYQPKYYHFYSAGNEYFPDSIETEVKRAVNIQILPQFESVEGYKYWNAFDENIINVSMYLIRKYNPSFVAIGFRGTDAYQHRYWSGLEPEYFDISLKEFEEKKHLITDYYKKIDKFLDYFIKNNYTIFFVSDHGFCRNDRKSGPRIIKYFKLNADMQHVNFLINRLLKEMGLLIFIPKDYWGDQIDFSKSKAYFYNNVKSGVEGIKINREIVHGDEIMELRRRICSLLKEAYFENSGKVFVNVEENIKANLTDLPDVTFNLGSVLKEGDIFFSNDFKKEPAGILFNYLLSKKGKKITKIIIEGGKYNLGDFIGYSYDGTHEKDGVVIMAGRNIRKNMLIKGAKIFDITPTILYLLGLPVAKDMDGKALVEAIDPEFVRNNSVKYIETYKQKKNESIKQAGGENIDDQIIKERLQSLGYAQ